MPNREAAPLVPLSRLWRLHRGTRSPLSLRGHLCWQTQHSLLYSVFVERLFLVFRVVCPVPHIGLPLKREYLRRGFQRLGRQILLCLYHWCVDAVYGVFEFESFSFRPRNKRQDHGQLDNQRSLEEKVERDTTANHLSFVHRQGQNVLL